MKVFNLIWKGLLMWATIAFVGIFVMSVDSLSLKQVLVGFSISIFLSYLVKRVISLQEMEIISGANLFDRLITPKERRGK